MAELTVYDRDVSPVFVAAAAGGDTFANDSYTELLAFNGGASAITITVTGVRACDQGFLHDSVQTLAAGELGRFGPFVASRFSDAARMATVTYSDVTGVTVAAQRQR